MIAVCQGRRGWARRPEPGHGFERLRGRGAHELMLFAVGFRLNLSAMQIGDGEEHLVIAPHQVSMMQMETLELLHLSVLGQLGIPRLAQKGFKIHNLFKAIIKFQAELVSRNMADFGDFQIGWVCLHFSFRVMRSGLLCFPSTKKSIQRRTMSSAFVLTSRLKSFS